VPMSLDRDAGDRSLDRSSRIWGCSMMPHRCSAMARRSPVWACCSPLPALAESGLLRISRKLYGEIGPAFYGLRTSLLMLLLMALLRIQRPEASQGARPGCLGPAARTGSVPRK